MIGKIPSMLGLSKDEVPLFNNLLEADGWPVK
jgi:hypothetical protein